VIVKKPLLMVDIDGVVSIFGFTQAQRPSGQFLTVDGIVHLLSAEAASNLLELAADFELWWCSGWEEKANDYLPRLLGLPGPLPFVSFDGVPGRDGSHWKLAAIDAAVPHQRPLAWLDDQLDESCAAWAKARPADTLLVMTDPAVGLVAEQAKQLRAWARTQASR